MAQAKRKPDLKIVTPQFSRRQWGIVQRQEKHAERVAVAMPIVQQIFSECAKQGISDASLAHRSGVSISTLRSWQKRQVSPQLATVLYLARILGITIS